MRIFINFYCLTRQKWEKKKKKKKKKRTKMQIRKEFEIFQSGNMTII